MKNLFQKIKDAYNGFSFKKKYRKAVDHLRKAKASFNDAIDSFTSMEIVQKVSVTLPLVGAIAAVASFILTGNLLLAVATYHLTHAAAKIISGESIMSCTSDGISILAVLISDNILHYTLIMMTLHLLKETHRKVKESDDEVKPLTT